MSFGIVGWSSIRCMVCEEWHPGIAVYTESPAGAPAVTIYVCENCVERIVTGAKEKAAKHGNAANLLRAYAHGEHHED